MHACVCVCVKLIVAFAFYSEYIKQTFDFLLVIATTCSIFHALTCLLCKSERDASIHVIGNGWQEACTRRASIDKTSSFASR